MGDSQIVVLGAGLGGTIAAYGNRAALKGKAQVTVVNKGDEYRFVPSNPWVAVPGVKKRRLGTGARP
jgi:sulfide:quinone oxidoreductase